MSLERDGQDATNDLSYMCLTALEHVKLPQPQLSAQISSRTPPKFLLRCCKVLRLGTGMPALFNSDIITLGMVNRGKSLQDARSGSVNGCVSPNCDGKDRMASSGYFNLAKCLELALNDGMERLTKKQVGPGTGDPAGFSSFDAAVEAFRKQVTHFVALKVEYDNIMRDIYATYCPVPFTSAVIDDCIDKGLDWHGGGARYKQAVISGVGVGTVADSLAGIKKHVFEYGTFTLAQLSRALDEDFTKDNLRRTAELARSLPGIEQIDLLPYHRLGEPKYANLSVDYPLHGAKAQPREAVERLKTILQDYGLRVRIGG